MMIGGENTEQITQITGMTGNGGPMTSMRISESDSHSDSESDEDGVSTVHEDYGPRAIELPDIDASNTTTTIVTMTNSSHVQIKPVTKIIGPVTIHQYPNTNSEVRIPDQTAEPRYGLPGIPQNCTATSTEKANVPEESGPHVTLKTSREKIFHVMVSSLSWKLGIILTLIVVLIVVVVIVYFTALRQYSEESTSSGYPGEINSEESETDLGDDIHIITKTRWGGYEIPDISYNRTLAHPIPLVIIGHTAGGPCTTVQICSTKLQSIQSDHITRGYGDIAYNFLVGGDGNIYQGLGWDIRNRLYNNSMWISFVGNYVILNVNERQQKAVQLLIDRGISLGKLDKDYLLTGHNQFENTLSPGRNLLAVMETWPHYNNRTFT